jgi:hypothetical protein
MQQTELRRRLSFRSSPVTDRDSDERFGDDWLSDVGDVDWVDVPTEETVGAGGGSEPAPGAYGPGGAVGRESQLADVIRRRRAVAGLIVAALVAAAIAVAVVLLRGGSSEPTPTTTAAPPATTPAPITPAAAAPPPATPALKVTLPASGALTVGPTQSAEVVQLQKALTQLGFDPGKADGVYGAGTQAAVVAFQNSKGLAADGVVGAETAKALNDALAAKSSAQP